MLSDVLHDSSSKMNFRGASMYEWKSSLIPSLLDLKKSHMGSPDHKALNTQAKNYTN